MCQATSCAVPRRRLSLGCLTLASAQPLSAMPPAVSAPPPFERQFEQAFDCAVSKGQRQQKEFGQPKQEQQGCWLQFDEMGTLADQGWPILEGVPMKLFYQMGQISSNVYEPILSDSKIRPVKFATHKERV